MKKKLVSCFLVMAMAVSTLAGCGAKNTNSSEASSVPAQEEALEFTGYPINTEQQLRWLLEGLNPEQPRAVKKWLPNKSDSYEKSL